MPTRFAGLILTAGCRHAGRPADGRDARPIQVLFRRRRSKSYLGSRWPSRQIETSALAPSLWSPAPPTASAPPWRATLAVEAMPSSIHHRGRASKPPRRLVSEIKAPRRSRRGAQGRPCSSDASARHSSPAPQSCLRPADRARSTTPRRSNRDSVADLDEDAMGRHFAIHAEAPAFLARDFAAQLPEGGAGQHRQHHRRARAAPVARLFQLHAQQIRARGP